MIALPEEPKENQEPSRNDDEGRFEFGGKRAMIMDIAGGLYALKKTLRSDIGFIEKEFMFRAGMEGAREYLSGLEEVLKDKDPREVVEMMLEQYSLRGYGDFRLRRLDVRSRILEISSSNTVEAWAFQANKDLQREGVCSYVSGVIAMIARIALKEPLDHDSALSAIETECVAQGSRECKFIVAPLSDLPKLVPPFQLPNKRNGTRALRSKLQQLL